MILAAAIKKSPLILGNENLLNRDIEAAWRYHNGTKLSWEIVHNIRHDLDFSIKPMPFKIYPHLEGEGLPADLPSSGVPALAGSPAQSEEWVPSRRDLAKLFYFAAGITKRGVFPEGEIHFRAAACWGVNNLRPMSPLQRFPPKETQRTRGWVKTEPALVGQILVGVDNIGQRMETARASRSVKARFKPPKRCLFGTLNFTLLVATVHGAPFPERYERPKGSARLAGTKG